MFLDVRPKLQTKPFGEIWAWSFCKVGVINVSVVGGTRLLACPFLDIQSNTFKKSGILNHVQVGNVRYRKKVDDIFESLKLDKGEWMESISKGETSIKEFLALVDESIKESNRCQLLEGLNNKAKLTIYKNFGGDVKFKRYLNGVGDAGTRSLFKLRSGTHGLNEELGRHSGREGKYMCNLCGEDCESVGHFLWNCPVYSERRALFLEHLKNNLGNEFEHFKSCDIAGKSHFILGTELWGSHYEQLLHLVKSYIIDIWELRKSKLYGSGPLQYRSRPGRDTACQGKGKFGKLGGEKSCIVVYGFARSSECEAHGPSATDHLSIIIIEPSKGFTIR